ncbi:MAG: hypothetical protein ACYTFG_16110 [Planctomycetota bacterium]|jgi:hypothetical protein
MRVALVIALLITCLCGQGCLSHFFLKSKGRFKSATIATGLASGGLLMLGGGLMGYAEVSGRQSAWGPSERDKLVAGSALGACGAAVGVVSMILGTLHYFLGTDSRSGPEYGYRRDEFEYLKDKYWAAKRRGY